MKDSFAKYIPLTVGAIAILSALAGAARVIDSRYAHHSELAQLQEDSEQTRLEFQLSLYQLELTALRDKATLTPDDVLRAKFLEDVIIKLQERLAGIVGG